MRDSNSTKKEHDIIRKIFEPLTHIGHPETPKIPLRSDVHFPKHMRKPITFGLADDCATWKLPENKELVVSKDMLVEGVHFIGKESPSDIAKKALRVNLSDLASGGATPYAYMLGLSLNKSHDKKWLSQFAEGLNKDQVNYHITLIGGDLVQTKGPLTISITIFGLVDPGAYVTRDGAQLNDYVYVSGTIGDPVIGLSLAINMAGLENETPHNWLSELRPEELEYLIKRYQLPTPRTLISAEISQFCTSAMDISDGLALDMMSLCQSSSRGADIYVKQLPLSKPLNRLLKSDPSLIEKIITGGDDYEILCTVPEKLASHFESACRAKHTHVTHIGQITQQDVKFLQDNDTQLNIAHMGYDHFNLD